MSQTPTNSPIAEPVTPAGGIPGGLSTPSLESQTDQLDPLAHLYKMSRTAGLGSGDYVAINPVAVTALVFGIASALVIVDNLFIVLPIVGLILGIIGWRQVRKSNGTQTGAVMAGLAVLLSLGLLGAKAGKEGLESIRRSADKAEVIRLIDSFGKNIAAIDPAKPADTSSHLDAAWAELDEGFKGVVGRQRFDTTWLETLSSPYYGPLLSMHSNDLIKFDTDARSGDQLCTSIAVAQFQRGEAPRWQVIFRKLNDHWYIDNMPDVFPPPAPAGGPGQRR
jgi:hypothetical protein